MADVTKGWARSTERYSGLKGKLSVTRSSPRTDGHRTSDASDAGMAIATPDTSPHCMNSTAATWKLPVGCPHQPDCRASRIADYQHRRWEVLGGQQTLERAILE